MHTTPPILATATALLLITATAAAPAAATTTAAAPPDPITLEYKVTGTLRARSLRTLRADGDRWLVEAQLHPRGLWRFAGKLHQRSEFRLSQDGAIQILRYQSKRNRPKPHHRRLLINHNSAQMRLNNHPHPLPPHTTILDFAMLPFLFTLLDPTDPTLPSQTFHLTNGKTLRPYRITPPHPTPLKTPFGTLNTWKIPIQPTNQTNRTITAWTARDYNNLMVELHIQRGDKTAVYRLVDCGCALAR